MSGGRVFVECSHLQASFVADGDNGELPVLDNDDDDLVTPNSYECYDGV